MHNYIRTFFTGKVYMEGSVAYIPQSAWIPNESLKNVILFGRSLDQVKYDTTIEACGLTKVFIYINVFIYIYMCIDKHFYVYRLTKVFIFDYTCFYICMCMINIHIYI
jgi:hypothetical protein